MVEARNLMATRWEVLLPGSDRVKLQAAAEMALDEIERLEQQLSRFLHTSDVSQINSSPAGVAVRLEPRLFALIQMAASIHQATEGAFDITLGPLLNAWGFTGAGAGEVHHPAIREARACCGLHLVDLDPAEQTLTLLHDSVEIDLGAIGKGYAIDRAVEMLDEAAVASALIHAGTSTSFGLGGPAGESAWIVGIRDPASPEGESLATVDLHDTALSVSAPHGRRSSDGKRDYGHILDPRTGEPTEAALLAAAVHESATLTDAISTALLVLGEEGPALMEARFPDVGFLVALGGKSSTVLTGGPDSRRPLLLHEARRNGEAR